LRVLVVNAGSSSVKLSVLGDDDESLASSDLAVEQGEIDDAELRSALAALPAADAVGHRIVHGGERFVEAVRIDPEVEAALRDLVDLAPLHQPKSLAALDAVNTALSDLPAVACFDTAFHATLPAAAATYALPSAWRERFGIRRFGFHGLSHAYASRRAAAMLGRRDLRVVTCHLGAGASLAAVRDGRSVDTTMGFTPLEGVPMATRSGTVDPGALLHALRRGLPPEELERVLEHDSGLAGLSGISGRVEELERSGEPVAELALAVYAYRIAGAVGALAVALGGLDALVFTAGVGENSGGVRARVCTRLGFLGVELDEDANASARPDAEIAAPGSPVRVVVLRAREDLVAARAARLLLGLAG
jgi:acetate kinase